MPSDESTSIVRRYFAEATRGNDEAIDELLDVDVVLHFPGSTSPVRGRDEYRNMIGTYREATPSLHVEVVDIREEGDAVTVSWTAAFHHTGTFKDHPSTGRQGTISGRDVIRIQNGRIVEIHDEVDFDSLQAQLGFRPNLD
jgi:steroid delta-isomerase-like uncharacterized protein